MTEDEQTEALAVLICRCDRVVTQSSQQTAALSIGFASKKKAKTGKRTTKNPNK